jgi:hypothetical protein
MGRRRRGRRRVGRRRMVETVWLLGLFTFSFLEKFLELLHVFKVHVYMHKCESVLGWIER